MAEDGSAHPEIELGQKYFDVAYPMRSIEVKGRVEGGYTFAITRSEVAAAMNKGEHYLLAMVRVPPDAVTAVRYLVEPFAHVADLPFATVSLNLKWADCWALGEEPE